MSKNNMKLNFTYGADGSLIRNEPNYWKGADNLMNENEMFDHYSQLETYKNLSDNSDNNLNQHLDIYLEQFKNYQEQNEKNINLNAYLSYQKPNFDNKVKVQEDFYNQTLNLEGNRLRNQYEGLINNLQNEYGKIFVDSKHLINDYKEQFNQKVSDHKSVKKQLLNIGQNL